MSVIGTVTALTGKVVAVKADGTERVLALGDEVLADELVKVGPDSHIEISTPNGMVALDSGQQWLVTSEAYADLENFDPADAIIQSPQVLQAALDAAGNLPEAAQAADNAQATEDPALALTGEQGSDVDAIQAAILAGEDPTAVAEATAAGETAAGGQEDNGTSTVVISRTGEEVTPDAGFGTTPESYSFTTPEEEEFGLILPTVSVEVEVEVEVEGPVDPEQPEVPDTPNEAHPVLVSGNNILILEGSDAPETNEVTFNLVLSEPFADDVIVTYQLNSGTATYGEDWTNGDNPDHIYTVTIPAGETSFPVTINIVEDKLVEGDETLTIKLLSADNADINPASDTGTVTIYDDDTAPVANDDANSITDGEEISYTVSGNVLDNDTDEDGDADPGNGLLSVVDAPVVVGHEYGTLTIQADGSYDFTLNAAGIEALIALTDDQSAEVTFDDAYQVTDGVNPGSMADVTITLNGIGTDALVTDDAQAVTEDADDPTLSVSGQVSVDDSDAGEDAFDNSTLSFGTRTNSDPSDLDATQLGTLTLDDDQGN
ncbi:retention module-containing protein, partial [Pontibacter sp. JAM-7]|uniref:retention module-containing protein n=1 Tax=Pontibacter sp. JAM-7 TaxID=3366581 RepID=UPI003AF5F831